MYLCSSSNVNGQHEADQQNASVATQPDEAASETLPTESTSDTVATTLTTTDVVYEPTAADKLNERDNVATATPSAGGPTNGLSKLSGHELDVAELKVKVICQEKNNTALKMELKCAELQVSCVSLTFQIVCVAMKAQWTNHVVAKLKLIQSLIFLLTNESSKCCRKQ
jgi:hypothetical protein